MYQLRSGQVPWILYCACQSTYSRISWNRLWLEVATLHTTQYPKQCSAVYVLRSDLPELIGYDLLKLEDGYIDPDVDESTKAFVDQRISSGTEKVMLWNSVALTNVLAVARLPD